jgi:hypothetical protein
VFLVLVGADYIVDVEFAVLPGSKRLTQNLAQSRISS